MQVTWPHSWLLSRLSLRLTRPKGPSRNMVPGKHAMLVILIRLLGRLPNPRMSMLNIGCCSGAGEWLRAAQTVGLIQNWEWLFVARSNGWSITQGGQQSLHRFPHTRFWDTVGVVGPGGGTDCWAHLGRFLAGPFHFGVLLASFRSQAVSRPIFGREVRRQRGHHELIGPDEGEAAKNRASVGH